jgi:murein DD-endopeptidase MepM/ murein hydrolase activator NlpD
MEFIGSDYQTKPLDSSMQDGKLLDLPKLADASANSIRQSIGEVQRINSTASNADAEAAGRKVVVQPKEGGGLVGALAGLGEVAVKYTEQQEKLAKERKKEEMAKAEKEYIIAANRLAASAPDYINKTNEGSIGYQRKIEELNTLYKDKVDGGVLQTQSLRMYSPIQQYQEQDITRLREEGKKIRDTNVQTLITQQIITVDTQLADLSNETDSTKAQTRVDNVYKVLTDTLVNSKLDGADKAVFINGVVTAIGKSSAAGAKIRGELMGAVRVINDTNLLIQQTEDMPVEQKNTLRLARLAILEPKIAKAYEDILDPAARRRADAEMARDQRELYNAAKQGTIDARKAFRISADYTQSMTAIYLKSDGTTRAAYKAAWQDIPALNAVVEAADNYDKDKSKLAALEGESRALSSTIAGLGKSDAKERLSWVQDAFKMPNLSLNISIASDLQDAVKNYAKALSQGTPAEVQKAQQEVEKFNKIALDAANDRVKFVQQEMKRVNTIWQPLDDLLKDPSKIEVALTRFRETTDNIKALEEQARQSTLRGQNSNFNMPQLAELQVGDVKFPLPFKAGTQVTYSGDYREWRGNRQHAGIDIAVPENTPLISPIGGVIATVRDDGNEGYGKFIDVRTPDGKYVRYAHLNTINVREGQQVLAGQVLGATGNTGSSTGAHLHMEVRNDMYGGVEATEDPIAWSVKNINNANRGLRARSGANTPEGVPPNAVPLSGAYLLDGKIYYTNGSAATPPYSNRNPIRDIPLPADKSKYVSSPEKNYGYQELAQNAPFRKELHRVAKSLGTPAQWLADAMAFETGGTFAASVTNSDGYTGLIQFGDEAAKDVGTTKYELRQMTNTEQLKYVEKFLKMRRDTYGLKYDKPEAIIMGIWGGVEHIQSYVRDPQSVRNVRDKNITFAEYVKRVGEHAGRKYQTSYDDKIRPVHTSYRASCAMCQALQRAGMGILPHEAP